MKSSLYYKIKLYFLCAIGFFSLPLMAQERYGIGTQQPHGSTLLHLESTNRGLLVPVMNASRLLSIANPEPGLILFDETNQRFKFRRTFEWNEIPDGTPTRRWLLTGVDFENQEDFRIGTNGSSPLQFRVNNNAYGLIGYGEGSSVYLGLGSGSTLALNSFGTVGYGGAGGSSRLSVGLGIGAASTSQSNQTGLVAIGTNAMRFAGGSHHVAIGVEAYEGVQQGTTAGAIPNIAIGGRTLKNATTAAGNIALGHEAMLTATTAQGNIGILSNTNGTRNILIRSAEVNGTDQIAIANGIEFTGGVGNILIGASGEDNKKYTSSHNVMINTGSRNMLLSTDAEEILIGGTTLANQTLLNPFISTQNQGANFTAKPVINKNGAVHLGLNAGVSEPGAMGVGIGFSSVTVGNHSVAVGSTSSTADNSVSLGFRAVGGTNNISIGWQSGNAGFGSDNVIIGSSAKSGNNVGDRNNQMILGNTNMTTWLFGRNTQVTNRALVVGTTTSNGNGAGLTSGGAWMSTSDVHTKEDFSHLNKQEILEKIAQLSVTRWRYKGTNEYHIGPMAQDFYAAFGLGTGDKHISTIDPAGLTTLAIQAMMERIAELEAEIEALEKE
jgi:hypothetical protein